MSVLTEMVYVTVPDQEGGLIDFAKAVEVEIDCEKFVRERTCHLIPFVEEDGSVIICNCSECDAALLNPYAASYCPNCGSRVVD